MFVLGSLVVRTDTRIKTPFEVVPLWSDEMLSYLIGENQTPCFGPDASNCEHLNRVCAIAVLISLSAVHRSRLEEMRRRTPLQQTESATPQYFAVQIRRAASNGKLAMFNSLSAR